jgi:hypothetical protein
VHKVPIAPVPERRYQSDIRVMELH